MLGFACAVLVLGLQGPVPKSLVGVNKIVMMGDSITEQGAGPTGYVTLVSKALAEAYPGNPIEVVNAGISGQKAPDMLARFREDVIDEHPQIVTLSVGVNDVWHDFRTPQWSARVPEGNSGRGVKLEIYLRDIDKMIDMAQAAGIKMILVSPTLIYEDLNCFENQRLSKYIEAEEALAKKRGVGYINLNRKFRAVVSAYQRQAGKSQLALTGDGVHMNPAGNALMANSILSYLGVPVKNRVSP